MKFASAVLPFAGAVFGAAISTRQVPQTSGIIWPVSYIALGDSFSAGIGAGKYTQPDNPLVKKCKRMTGSYPTQVKGLFPRIDDNNFLFESCSGDKLENIDAQLSNLGGTRAQVVTLSISGNDIKFSAVVEKCVYNVLPLGKSDATADKECDAALADAAKLIADEKIWTTYKEKVDDIMAKVMLADIRGIPIPWSVLLITGYPKFWGDVKKDGDACSKLRLKIPEAILGSIALNGNYLRPEVRRRMNKLVVAVNDKIKAEILPINTDKIEFVDIDPLYEGHRLCEDGATDPVGANSDSAWLTTFETKLQEDSFVPDPDSALEAQWSTLTQGLHPGDGFAPNELKINSNFHPKTGGHSMTAQAVHDRIVDWGNRHEHTPTPPPQQCYPADAPDLPAMIFVDANIKLDPNQLLYKLRETLCGNRCEIPTGIDTLAGAIVQGDGGRCEISIGLQGSSEAYAIRDRSISGDEQTQLC
ncbi:hypothetical protein HYALB_00008117 [Hymenoscyphus albidus]|uniref:SGNH hydrolase-type esterase domain-containing protein n=1 Tax=Hymenoscyphus albidus TaxID=595503 RepID=A0A9N9LWN4_9HELO|nr:hypothetical protein HYALB_00008117 [Hymenoscyphus albidus]